MKITKRQLGKIIAEETKNLLEYEVYVDDDGNIYDDEGNVTRRGRSFGRRYGGQTYGGTNPPWRGSAGRGRSAKPRKTSYVGPGANAEKIAAVEKALEVKPNNFLSSVLDQMNQGRGLSDKQNKIVKKILAKSNPDAAKLFESSEISEARVQARGATTMKITKRQLRSIIREAVLNEMSEEEPYLDQTGDYAHMMGPGGMHSQEVPGPEAEMDEVEELAARLGVGVGDLESVMMEMGLTITPAEPYR